MKFNYPDKTRDDFLKDVVSQLVQRRRDLKMTQEELNYKLGVADRLVSKWECGDRTPTAFHLYCWSDALNGHLVFVPDDVVSAKQVIQGQKEAISNDDEPLCCVSKQAA
ncbi:helix-turn-helix transcriptional regulator [uncultured Roseivirga sp.]|uniref:helix-turn-helix domain-containing protein n=1 Tax=uncultured Roseivirga sp. TaxID=543088 RepID=UPI002589F2B0|nr:helix-turn-helix transcriptional regulator [uncultured Roseivirga sp.]MEC7754023.1 helix-turn-helix transcriptional regulator [Bacteroidota bacterium]|tara:strand:+ start:3852 stop:4178 length:327 start_codon:yes stop_codon:yes gene_type:complete